MCKAYRYHSSVQGRFSRVDPENAGADESDPQSWNGYAYARNNPLLFSDPDGREFQICYQGGDCHLYTDEQFKQIKADATDLGSVFQNGKIYNEIDGRMVATGSYTRTDTSGMWDDVSPQLSDRLGPVLTVAKVEAVIIMSCALPAGGGGSLTSLGLEATEATAATATVATTTTVAPQAASAIRNAISGFTKHGINSAISHDGVGVSTRAILNTLKNPIKVVAQSGGRVKIVGKEATVILNRSGKVITTWARSSASTRVKP